MYNEPYLNHIGISVIASRFLYIIHDLGNTLISLYCIKCFIVASYLHGDYLEITYNTMLSKMYSVDLHRDLNTFIAPRFYWPMTRRSWQHNGCSLLYTSRQLCAHNIQYQYYMCESLSSTFYS